MFTYILFPIAQFVNGYFQKLLDIFGYFLHFCLSSGFSENNIKQIVNYRTKTNFTNNFCEFDIDFNLYIMYNRIEESVARVCVHKEEI